MQIYPIRIIPIRSTVDDNDDYCHLRTCDEDCLTICADDNSSHTDHHNVYSLQKISVITARNGNEENLLHEANPGAASPFLVWIKFL